MTLLERGIVLNDWQQRHYALEPNRIAQDHSQARRIGKTFLSYVMVLEKTINSDTTIVIDPSIDPDNVTYRIGAEWKSNLIAFAGKYYPEVTLTKGRLGLCAKAQPKSKKLRLLNAIKDFK